LPQEVINVTSQQYALPTIHETILDLHAVEVEVVELVAEADQDEKAVEVLIAVDVTVHPMAAIEAIRKTNGWHFPLKTARRLGTSEPRETER
jgi:hypothetical protein